MNAPIDPQLTWDREDAVHRLNRLQHLRMQLAAAEQAVTSCRAAYARASAEEKRLRAELYAQLEIETTPDLFTPRGQQVEDDPAEDLSKVPGRRLEQVPLDHILQSEHAAYLGERGIKTLAQLVDLAIEAKQPLDMVLSDKYGMRISDAVDVLFTAVEWLKENPAGETCDRRCRACGCIEAECAGCYLCTGTYCDWVEDDLCSACQQQKADEGEVIETGIEKVLEQASDADACEQADPLAHDCPQCGAQPGERCRSSKGKGCAPHRQRGKPQKPEPAEDASLFEQALDGHPWPDWLISDVIGHANIVDRFPSKSLTKPISVRPISWDNRLWVYVGGIWGAGKGSWDKAELLSLIPAAEFEERYVSIPTKFQPKLPADPTAEDRRQYYTGVVVKVGRKEFAIAPASEGRTVVRRKEQS